MLRALILVPRSAFCYDKYMRTVVITGVSHGLGLVTAQEFAKNGWKVIGTGRSPRPDNLQQDIEYRQFDSSDTAACEAFWSNLAQEPDICLINNAGGYAGGGLEDTPAEVFVKQMQSNYFAAVYMTKGLVSTIPSAKIINIISNNANAPQAGDAAYGASKAAEKYFFQTLQKELDSSKYKITNLYPNSIATQGPNSSAIDPTDLAAFVRQIAESEKSFYFTDVTLFASKN